MKSLVMILGLSLSLQAAALECPLDNGPFGARPGEVLKLVCQSPGGTLVVDGHMVFLPKNLCIYKGVADTIYRLATSEKSRDFTAKDVVQDNLTHDKLHLHKSERVFPSGSFARSYTIKNTFKLSGSSGQYEYENNSPMPYSYKQDFKCEQ